MLIFLFGAVSIVSYLCFSHSFFTIVPSTSARRNAPHGQSKEINANAPPSSSQDCVDRVTHVKCSAGVLYRSVSARGMAFGGPSRNAQAVTVPVVAEQRQSRRHAVGVGEVPCPALALFVKPPLPRDVAGVAPLEFRLGEAVRFCHLHQEEMEMEIKLRFSTELRLRGSVTKVTKCTSSVKERHAPQEEGIPLISAYYLS